MNSLNNDLSTYIGQNFHVLENNVSSPDEADLFFLCELHDCIPILKANASFINLFAPSESAVLLEGIKAHEKVTCENDPWMHFIDRDDLDFIGWDIDMMEMVKEDYRSIYQKELAEDSEIFQSLFPRVTLKTFCIKTSSTL